MAMTSGRLTIFPSLKISNPSRPSRFLCNFASSFKPSSSKPATALLVTGNRNLGPLKGGTGLLERPTFDQSQFDPIPQAEEGTCRVICADDDTRMDPTGRGGGDMGRLRDKRSVGSGDSYRVLLIDDALHTEQLVEKALPQAVPSITVSNASKLFHVSREIGAAVVIVTVKEHAEFYAQMMIRCGLRSAIEPDSNLGLN